MADRRRITVSAVGDLALVRFLDRKIVDPANIEEVGDEMFQLLEKDKFKNIILNFEGVEFLGSAALNKLLMMDKKVKAAGGKLRLCALRGEIMEVFTITKLTKVFDIKKTEADALKAFGVAI
jgi:anti-sigma B factor antagonist